MFKYLHKYLENKKSIESITIRHFPSHSLHKYLDNNFTKEMLSKEKWKNQKIFNELERYQVQMQKQWKTAIDVEINYNGEGGREERESKWKKDNQ